MRDDKQGSAAVNMFHDQNLVNLNRKDSTHFGTSEQGRGPLESIFRQIVFKPLVFGSFGEMSSNVVQLVETAVEYGVEHIGRNMAAMTVDTEDCSEEAIHKPDVNGGVEGLCQPSPR